MSEAITGLLPFTIGAAQVPVWVIMVLFLLRRGEGIATAAAFVAGLTAVRLGQGIIFGLLVAGTAPTRSGDERSLLSSLPSLIIGVVLWGVAIGQLRAGGDAERLPPVWLTRLRALSPVAAFGFGALLIAVSFKQWAFTLGAIGVIGAAQLDRTEAVIVYLIFVLGAEALVLLPIVVTLLFRGQSAALLERVGAWLEWNLRPIVIAVSVIFGTYFLWKGLAPLFP